MSLDAQYKTFKADLLGYGEVSFDEFRRRVLPLRSRRNRWTYAETKYIEGLVSRGAGYALQQFLGRNHRPAAAAIGSAQLRPEPMAKAKLDDHMVFFTMKCLREGWDAQRVVAFVGHLERGASPDAPARDKNAPDVWAEPECAQLAEMYRDAGPAFRTTVCDHLSRVIMAAATRAEAEAKDKTAGLVRDYVEANAEDVRAYIKACT